MVSVATDGAKASARGADFLRATYSQDFKPLVDRSAVAGTLESVVGRLVDFVRADARHMVLLPCHDRAEGGAPWRRSMAARVAGRRAQWSFSVRRILT